MAFDPDIADDALLIDGSETVTLVGSATVTVAAAKRSPLATAESELAGELLTAGDLTWLLPLASLAGIAPRPGDTIVDAASTSWTIVNAQYSPLTQVWRSLCRQQR